MVLQYSAIGIQSDIRTALKRADIRKSLEYVAESIKGAIAFCKLD